MILPRGKCQRPRSYCILKFRLQPSLNAVLITGVDIGLWRLMAENGADTPQKVEDLAKPLGIDPVLLGPLSDPTAAPSERKHELTVYLQAVYCAMPAPWATSRRRGRMSTSRRAFRCR